MTATGNAEGAERASLEMFQRIKRDADAAFAAARDPHPIVRPAHVKRALVTAHTRYREECRRRAAAAPHHRRAVIPHRNRWPDALS